jgi:hypothetical protein
MRDVTFLSNPYNVMDNNRLIYNIADFLAPSEAASTIAITVETNNSFEISNKTNNTNATSLRNVTATDKKDVGENNSAPSNSS